MSELYLCYDLKGIQSFIFAVPRLKYISGGSALIDRFDREIAPGLDRKGHIFSGGGKGAFLCDDDSSADALQSKLVQEAHAVGLSICFGRHGDFSEASQMADSTFPYLPDGSQLEGHPCKESGLYPVADGGVHEAIQRRVWDRNDRMSRWYGDELLDGISLPSFIADPKACEFIRDVSSDSADGEGGFTALGKRNRWAIVAMDGNDMGLQHREASRRWQGEPEKMLGWLKAMSQGLDDCSRGACRKAIERMLVEWAGTEAGRRELDEAARGGVCWLPIRPLVVGGDDIVVICHARHAMDFVREATARFSEISAELARKAQEEGVDLWPATGGSLSISSGVLFAPVSLPLSAAIPYAEALMASAKGLGRSLNAGQKNVPSPACVDWESVSEGVIDSPAARRQRELRFLDEDIGEVVELTRRPYSVEQLEGLRKLAERYQKVPATIRHQVLPGLRNGYWDRQAYVARLMKHQAELAGDLSEPEPPGLKGEGRWQKGDAATVKGRKAPCRTTDVVDALLLLEEEGRMDSGSSREEAK